MRPPRFLRLRAALLAGAGRAAMIVAALAAPATVHAQVTPDDQNQHYEFIDELLNVDLGRPFGDPLFSGHLPPARTLLIRPRTNFIPELYKSVEHI
jgi:hypothetical protein